MSLDGQGGEKPTITIVPPKSKLGTWAVIGVILAIVVLAILMGGCYYAAVRPGKAKKQNATKVKFRILQQIY